MATYDAKAAESCRDDKLHQLISRLFAEEMGKI